MGVAVVVYSEIFKAYMLYSLFIVLLLWEISGVLPTGQSG